jgi:hypothetical protein
MTGQHVRLRNKTNKTNKRVVGGTGAETQSPSSTSPKSGTKVGDIPSDVVSSILSQLPIQDMLSIGKSNKHFSKHIVLPFKKDDFVAINEFFSKVFPKYDRSIRFIITEPVATSSTIFQKLPFIEKSRLPGTLPNLELNVTTNKNQLKVAFTYGGVVSDNNLDSREAPTSPKSVLFEDKFEGHGSQGSSPLPGSKGWLAADVILRILMLMGELNRDILIWFNPSRDLRFRGSDIYLEAVPILFVKLLKQFGSPLVKIHAFDVYVSTGTFEDKKDLQRFVQ